MISDAHASRSRMAICTALAGLAVTSGGWITAPGVAAAAPPKGNHYQCYEVLKQPAFKPRTVELADQFGKRKVEVLGITRICNPATKRVANAVYEPVDKTLHYVCYKLGKAEQASRMVQVANQFGTSTLVVGQPLELCLPSSKKLIK